VTVKQTARQGSELLLSSDTDSLLDTPQNLHVIRPAPLKNIDEPTMLPPSATHFKDVKNLRKA